MTDRAAPIDFYFDFISPYGYLAATRIEEIGAKYRRRRRMAPVPARRDGAAGDGHQAADGDASQVGLPRGRPAAHGAAARRPAHHPRSRRCQRRGGLARLLLARRGKTRPQAKALARRLLERLWVEGRDITDPGVVADEAAALGVSTVKRSADVALGDPAGQGPAALRRRCGNRAEGLRLAVLHRRRPADLGRRPVVDDRALAAPRVLGADPGNPAIAPAAPPRRPCPGARSCGSCRSR